MAQAEKHQPSEHEALSSIPSTTKNQKLFQEMGMLTTLIW
jgi:hypothetical protein